MPATGMDAEVRLKADMQVRNRGGNRPTLFAQVESRENNGQIKSWKKWAGKVSCQGMRVPALPNSDRAQNNIAAPSSLPTGTLQCGAFKFILPAMCRIVLALDMNQTFHHVVRTRRCSAGISLHRAESWIRSCTVVVGCFLLSTGSVVHAQTLNGMLAEFHKVSAEGEMSHLVDIDNDSLQLNRDDGFYSSGMRYTQKYALRGERGVTTYGWRLGQDIYTASDIKLPPAQVGPPNHPYAGWLYGGLFRHLQRPDGTYVQVGLDIGCLGPCSGAEGTQTSFHRILNQPLPKGWDKQVKNELGLVLHAEMAPVRWMLARSLDVMPSVRLRFGNIFTDFGAGVTVRAGQLHAIPGQSAWHGFLRADMRAVGYNATLQGGYFSKNNPHTVEPKRFVGEAELGVVWQKGQYGIVASLVRRGNEIRALRNSTGAQNFIHLQFSYTP